MDKIKFVDPSLFTAEDEARMAAKIDLLDIRSRFSFLTNNVSLNRARP